MRPATGAVKCVGLLVPIRVALSAPREIAIVEPWICTLTPPFDRVSAPSAVRRTPLRSQMCDTTSAGKTRVDPICRVDTALERSAATGHDNHIAQTVCSTRRAGQDLSQRLSAGTHGYTITTGTLSALDSW